MSEKGRGGEGIEGRHVLLALLGFFGAILIVNGVFLYYALATFGGGDTGSPYQKGLRYNQTIAEAARLAERGWSSGLAYDRSAGRISLQLRDRARSARARLGASAAAPGAPPPTGRMCGLSSKRPSPEPMSPRSISAPANGWCSFGPTELSRGDAPAYRLKQRLFVDAAP